MVLLDVFIGLRIGELMGLTWNDVDFKSCVIAVTKASQYLPSMGTFEKCTKNESSNRKMPVPKPIIDALKDYRKWWLEQQVKCGDQWIDGANHLFTIWNGEPAIDVFGLNIYGNQPHIFGIGTDNIIYLNFRDHEGHWSGWKNGRYLL